ncbi:hypothetical protein ABT124_15995 [Streptomyces sp. NPDC001982]|uniref:hypothetical protein n=1 Tax=Streptomyces sp. NPDC001982 TaxID=3154405 RepID=UPI003319855D
MGIGSRRAMTGAATALLLCFGMAGTAAAEEAPSDNTTVSDDQTADINDNQGWEDEFEQPVREVTPTRCDGSLTWFTITSKKAIHVPAWWNGTKYKDGPGGSMTVKVEKVGTISAEITVGFEGELKGVVASAKASVSSTIKGSVGVTVGHTYTHDVRPNKYGHLQYGSWGYKVTWKKYRSTGNGCNGKEVAHGSATLPRTEVGWSGGKPRHDIFEPPGFARRLRCNGVGSAARCVYVRQRRR